MYKTKIKNPILRGFNPDPNILRVEDTYYLVVSSFEWLPGVRAYSSKDLVNWTHVTDILTHQVNLQGNPLNCSIWAPQLSYSNGKFYLIYTDVKSTARPFKDSHNYLITADEITGPWSEPIYLNSSGFDPSLFHDEDGRKWLLNEIWDYRMTTSNKSAGIVLQEYDEELKAVTGPVYKIFDGTELAKTEAPHIYRHQEYYYLITAEGGTGTGHTVTVCRSTSITGPYELDERPLLTASDKPDSPLQCSGHGSLVETPQGKWYMAYLCTRPLNGAAILGRETAIQEVVWEDGWLRLETGEDGPAVETYIETEEQITQQIKTAFHDDFSGKIKSEWNALRIMPDNSWCNIEENPGYLRLFSGESIQSSFDNHILAIRQKDFDFEAQTKVEFTPKTFNQMAGITLFLNTQNYMYCYITWDEKEGKVIRFILSIDGEYELSDVIIPITEQWVSLKVAVSGPVGKFYYREDDKHPWQQVGAPQDMSTLAGGFTGNFVGIGVHDMDRKAGCSADFDYFIYEGLDK
ncbi:beta-xylosidase [Enterococcus sp. JM4C]|uniref:glycoside hydrolase family 43 protein n=1 Tax=Candidatus Enterococcus huntleyi TaxID=1857217 RepID=UPI00137B1124|nr:glycoside hydrolase family 43 protein [Enterococcus sp. JM4C]KAF1299170.1 beta-xylosidase [Enterococcus sp. JM4C]